MSLITSSLLALSLATSAYTSPLSTPSYNAPSQRSPFLSAPLLEDQIHGTVNNSYIVKLRDGLHPSLVDNHFNFLQSKHAENPLVGENSGLKHVYSFSINGYAGHFEDSVIEQVRELPEVDYVERDQVVRISDEQLSEPTMATQRGAPWGLARVSHRPTLSFSTFTKYQYDADGGEGVDVYVIDTGIYHKHPDFEGRASWGKTIPQNDVDEDANGHGTHCAGTIASKTYGVAKKANVIAVKVLGSNGSGTMSDVIAGVDWAAQSTKNKADKAKAAGSSKHKGSVANMSLGGGKSPTLDVVVNKATDAGLHFAVAAGNENRDACNSSPAAAEKAVTVGASTIGDERAYFSNHGKCVDIFGPGLNIKSTWNDGGINTISGTSMASPHTAGVLAYLLSIYPSATFNPKLYDTEAFDLESEAQSHFATLYSVAHSALPRFIANFLPPPQVFEVDAAPVPSKPMSAADLKRALLALGTPNMLVGKLPEGTPNLLLFNNATA